MDGLSEGSVPIAVAARVYGKDKQWVRAGIINGYLPIGFATKDGVVITDIKEQGKGGRISYYISPKQFFDHTGYVWKGEKS